MLTRAAARKADAAADTAYERVTPGDNGHVASASIDATCDKATICGTIAYSDVPHILGSATPNTKITTQNARSTHYESHRIRAGLPEQLQSLLNPPAEVLEVSANNVTLENTSNRQRAVEADHDHGVSVIDTRSDVPSLPTNKRRLGPKISRDSIRGGWEALPHNLGKLWIPNTASEINSSGINKTSQTAEIDETTADDTAMSHQSNTCNVADDIESSINVTGHDLRFDNSIHLSTMAIESAIESASTSAADEGQMKRKNFGKEDQADNNSPQKRQCYLESTIRVGITEEQNEVEYGDELKKTKRKARRTKDNPYGLTPGETPYPDWASPTTQQCQEVYDILVKMHDDVKPLPPGKIPAPSLEVAGCGEVPSILDGLIRTVLSGSTTFESADKMLQALVQRFGVLEHGIGKGSVNWNKVRIAEYDDVYKQLRNGGLGKLKTQNIQAILNMVYDENMERRASYLYEKETAIQADVAGVPKKTEGQKKLEIFKAEQEILSLDYMHSMETYEAMQHFVRYPGVGIKTAACVTLFSLQRPCFAVDTHVFRMSRWLGWVPQKCNEDDTFGHLEVRCPDILKYGLHQLFIRHGKTCHRCNNKSFLGTEAWNQTHCPLEHLINRFSKSVVKPAEVKTQDEEGK